VARELVWVTGGRSQQRKGVGGPSYSGKEEAQLTMVRKELWRQACWA
jgi:hypothetical protein